MQIGEKLEVFRDFTLDVARENSSKITAQYEDALQAGIGRIPEKQTGRTGT